ncbi:MAG: hypothetical protein MJZ91_11030 [Bacteroidales bacterium]|nr:hypothetical protein [Bacteroidales bacterium]
MKLKHLILFLAVVLAACSSRHPVETRFIASPNKQLQAIDSLMWKQPDSAFAVLRQFAASSEADSLDEFNGHYCQMLLSELLYKNDCEQTNREELLTAVDYFDSLTIALNDSPQPRSRHCGLGPQSPGQNDNLVFLDARAHYINGVGWYEQDSIVPACQAYLKALQVMESHFKDDELDRNMIRFMGLLNIRLSNLFYYNDAVMQAIETIRKSLVYFEKSVSSTDVANAMMRVGRCFRLDNSLDSAFFYYKKALSIANENGFQKIRFSAMSEIAPLYYEKGLKDSAFIILHEALSNCTTKDDSLATCMGLGQLFYKEHNYDSAVFYLEQSVKRKTFDTETASADLLHDSYLALGDKDKALYYGKIYQENMSIYAEKSSKKIEIATLYNEYLQQQQETHQTHMFSRYLLVVCLLVLCMVCLFLYGRSAKRKSALTQSQLSGKVKAIKQLVKEQEAIITTQRAELEMLRQKEKPDFETVYASFLQEPICRHILSEIQDENITVGLRCPAYEKLALGLEQKQQFWKTVDYYFPQFFSNLAKQYPRLTTSDGRYACFYLLDINDGQVAVLMGVSYQSVWKRSKKMKEVMDGVNDLSMVMKSIAKTSIN